MSYKAYPFFRDILINECIYFASKNKKLVRLNYKSEAYVGVWTEGKCGRIIFNKS